MLQDHPNRPFPNFPGVFRRRAHDSILSRFRVSGKPGAVHVLAGYDREVAMKKSRFTETQILSILNEADVSVSVQKVCRKHGNGNATYYNWELDFPHYREHPGASF
jgi:hypothetical protein